MVLFAICDDAGPGVDVRSLNDQGLDLPGGDEGSLAQRAIHPLLDADGAAGLHPGLADLAGDHDVAGGGHVYPAVHVAVHVQIARDLKFALELV